MTSPGLKMASVGDNEKMTMRLNCGLIAMAGGWVHTVHSAHDQMEQLFVVMLAKSSINSGSIVSTGLEFPQATVLAEPWVSLSELAIILWNDFWRGLLARIGIVTWDVNIWEFLQDSTSANKSQAESTEAITSSEPPAQLHSPDIVHLPQIAYNWWISAQGKHKHPCIFIGSVAYWCISRQTFRDFTEESRLNLLRPKDDDSCRPFAVVG